MLERKVVPLPEGCQFLGESSVSRHTKNAAKRTCAKVSAGEELDLLVLCLRRATLASEGFSHCEMVSLFPVGPAVALCYAVAVQVRRTIVLQRAMEKDFQREREGKRQRERDRPVKAGASGKKLFGFLPV